MLQLENTSPFESTIMLLPDERGIDTLHVVVKGTFALGNQTTLAEEQVPLTLEDEYWGEPGQSSLKYPSEAHLAKPGTDVIVVAEACAPDGKPVRILDVGIAVAGRKHGGKVFGERVWAGNRMIVQPSDPLPFVRMPLTYERTYGGTQVADAEKRTTLAEMRNPIGRGLKGKRGVHDMIGELLPNIEDVRAPLRRPGDATGVIGFGAVLPTWQPRRQHAGTYDEKWQKTRAPYYPNDFDVRFFQLAAPELTFPQPLRGGEPVVLLNLSPRGREQFSLPVCDVGVTVWIDRTQETPEARLQTVLLEPTIGRLCLSWRATVPCDKKTLKVHKVDVTLRNMELN